MDLSETPHLSLTVHALQLLFWFQSFNNEEQVLSILYLNLNSINLSETSHLLLTAHALQLVLILL